MTELAFVKRILLFLFVVAYELNSERSLLQILARDDKTSDDFTTQADFHCKCEEASNKFTQLHANKSSHWPDPNVRETAAHCLELSPTVLERVPPVNLTLFDTLDYSKFLQISPQTPISVGCARSLKVQSHRFKIEQPRGTIEHPFTTVNRFYSRTEQEERLAHFRACGSFPKQNGIKSEVPALSPPIIAENNLLDIVEDGEMVRSSYNPDERVEMIRSFPILVMSYSVGSTGHCSSPTLVQLAPYSESDVPLRQFIELFGNRNDTDVCKNCHVLNRLHVRRFVFGCRAVHVISRELSSPLPHDQLLFWTSQNSSGENSDPVILPPEVGNMSGAMFLKFILATKFAFDKV